MISVKGKRIGDLRSKAFGQPFDTIGRSLQALNRPASARRRAFVVMNGLRPVREPDAKP